MPTFYEDFMMIRLRSNSPGCCSLNYINSAPIRQLAERWISRYGRRHYWLVPILFDTKIGVVGGMLRDGSTA